MAGVSSRFSLTAYFVNDEENAEKLAQRVFVVYFISVFYIVVRINNYEKRF